MDFPDDHCMLVAELVIVLCLCFRYMLAATPTYVLTLLPYHALMWLGATHPHSNYSGPHSEEKGTAPTGLLKHSQKNICRAARCKFERNFADVLAPRV